MHRPFARGLSISLGLVTLIAAGSAAASTSGTRTSSFAYDTGSGLITQEVVEPSITALRLATATTYDSYGNKTAVTVSGVDITSRTNTTSYDAKGQFATASSNALGQSESWQYDARFGVPTSHTGPNGLTTTWSYDSLGRKVQETRPDGTQTKWTYSYCNGVAGGTASCPTNGAYLVKAVPYAADGTTQNGPQSIAYYDFLTRPLASDTQGFDGSTVRSATQYDALGREVQTSRPYFLSGGTPRWLVKAYDALGRVITQTAPDSSVTSFAYHGLTTSVTNALSQITTTTKNAQGLIASVTDALSHTSTYAYDPFGNLLSTTDPMGNVSSATYDLRGRKVSINDPDMGAWTYSYNTLGQLTSQTDAKGQTATLSYDLLGRMTQRVEPDLTSNWTYDSAANGIGKLATATTNLGYQRNHSYDSLGRPTQVSITVDGTAYVNATSYDANGRVLTQTYPSGFAVKYSYTSLGYQSQLSDNASSQVFWTANARDAEMHLTGQTAGNGIATTQTFDPNTGALTAIQAGASNGVENYTYSYDVLGNLLNRTDGNSGVNESFQYDSLNRLTQDSLSALVVKLITYDPIGNITSKSDVGNYAYPAAGLARPHAVSGTTGVLNATFTYDANGNQIAGAGRTIGFSSFNKPTSITSGSKTLTFTHDSEHARVKQVSPEGTTLYLGGVEKFIGTSGVTTWNEYLVVSGMTVGERFERSDGTVTLRYFHLDHLGSVSVLTDETGTVVERLSYDPWGKRRYANGTDDPTGSITSQTTHGFTNHEELDDVGLVHMNGRVYDPQLGRFTSADPVIEQLYSTQGWNRYSYVGNNPLAYTDPTGYCFLGCFWKPVFHAIGSIPILQAAIAIVAAVTAQYYMITEVYSLTSVTQLSVSQAMVTAGVSGAVGGAISTGTLKGALLGAVTSEAFYGVGSVTDFHGADWSHAMENPGHFAANIAGHAAVGCVMGAAGGGKCGSGAISAGMSGAVGPLLASSNMASGTAISATVGGLGSVLGGGKFENGAITGAFGYLYNSKAVQLADGRTIVEGADPSYVFEKAAALFYAPLKWLGSFYSWVDSGVSVSDLLNGSTLISNKPNLQQFSRSGGFGDALNDFNSLRPDNIRPIPNPNQSGGMVGELSGGRMVNVRPSSSGGQPTLEIQNPVGADIKIRYQ